MRRERRVAPSPPGRTRPTRRPRSRAALPRARTGRNDSRFSHVRRSIGHGVDALQTRAPSRAWPAPSPWRSSRGHEAREVAHTGRVVDARLLLLTSAPGVRQAGRRASARSGVLTGLTIASGPSGARFRIGIWTWPQYEDHGPITPTSFAHSQRRSRSRRTSGTRSRRSAGWRRRTTGSRPCSSPARKSRRSSTTRIASSSARGSGAARPWSGRSDAIRTSGFSVRETTSPQVDAVRAPSVVPPATLTHAASAPAASACGAPIAVLAVTWFVRGSIRETRPST